MVNDILRPLYRYMQENRNNYTYTINKAVASHFTGNNQVFFSVDELIHIFTLNSETRRKAKEMEKTNDLSSGTFPLGTYKVDTGFK